METSVEVTSLPLSSDEAAVSATPAPDVAGASVLVEQLAAAHAEIARLKAENAAMLKALNEFFQIAMNP